ncbi:ROK family protein [Paenibacillus beijingensis]|uniref:Glucokinase n=1 Tax=Paenibacillus beijingensis TaxID=1126833 RepID=A0A0D5NH73_9BACL|nr:ROK family protein [Paenibacillus beijingensis]AJY74729.1 hypothetical protein VN24_09220 [Paenibacillus beijingensis]
MLNECALGIDLGGTNIKAGLVGMDGTLLHRMLAPTGADAGGEAIYAKLLQTVRSLKAEADKQGLAIRGIGIGTAGQVDQRRQKVASATSNLPGWADIPLTERMACDTGLPVRIDNDVNVLAAGEAWLGAGRPWDSFLCVTLGTGIGGCFVSDKRPYYGKHGYAGEFGHHVIQAGGAPCNCGRSGCWEQYASVTALRRTLDRVFGVDSGITPEVLFERARAGIPEALRIVDDYAEHVAAGLINLIHLFDPDGIVIGGAITAQGEFLLGRIRRLTGAGTLAAYAEDPVPVEPALLGDNAGIIGAARIAAEATQAL